MPDDTRYITIIRAPKDNVESVFGFFQVRNLVIEDVILYCKCDCCRINEDTNAFLVKI